VYDYDQKPIDIHTFIEIAKNIFQYSNESIIVTDAQNRILFVNPAFEIVTGYSAEEVIGKNPRVLRSGMHDKPFYEKMWNDIEQQWRNSIKYLKSNLVILYKDIMYLSCCQLANYMSF
jgi:PAS domain-containing protein